MELILILTQNAFHTSIDCSYTYLSRIQPITYIALVQNQKKTDSHTDHDEKYQQTRNTEIEVFGQCCINSTVCRCLQCIDTDDADLKNIYNIFTQYVNT